MWRTVSKGNYIVTETNAQATGWDSKGQYPPYDGQLHQNVYAHLASGSNIRQAAAGRLGQAHVARDDSVEHLVPEVGVELVADLRLQRDARVEHHPQQTDQLQGAVHSLYA